MDAVMHAVDGEIAGAQQLGEPVGEIAVVFDQKDAHGSGTDGGATELNDMIARPPASGSHPDDLRRYAPAGSDPPGIPRQRHRPATRPVTPRARTVARRCRCRPTTPRRQRG